MITHRLLVVISIGRDVHSFLRDLVLVQAGDLWPRPSIGVQALGVSCSNWIPGMDIHIRAYTTWCSKVRCKRFFSHFLSPFLFPFNLGPVDNSRDETFLMGWGFFDAIEHFSSDTRPRRLRFESTYTRPSPCSGFVFNWFIISYIHTHNMQYVYLTYIRMYVCMYVHTPAGCRFVRNYYT